MNYVALEMLVVSSLMQCLVQMRSTEFYVADTLLNRVDQESGYWVLASLNEWIVGLHCSQFK